jgi:hypothetical protein
MRQLRFQQAVTVGPLTVPHWEILSFQRLLLSRMLRHWQETPAFLERPPLGFALDDPEATCCCPGATGIFFLENKALAVSDNVSSVSW